MLAGSLQPHQQKIICDITTEIVNHFRLELSENKLKALQVSQIFYCKHPFQFSFSNVNQDEMQNVSELLFSLPSIKVINDYKDTAIGMLILSAIPHFFLFSREW